MIIILNFLLRFSNNLSTEPPLFLVRLRDPGKTLVKLDNSLKTIICHIIRYNFDYSRQIDKGLLTMKLKQWRLLRPLVHSLAASETSQTVGEGRGLLGRDTIGGGEEGQDGGTVQWW